MWRGQFIQSDEAVALEPERQRMPEGHGASDAVRTLLKHCSVEVTTRDARAVEECAAHLDPGTETYISFLPGDEYHAVIARAAQLRHAGLVPVPHVAARWLVSFTQAADFLERLSGEAGCDRALVIAGDVERVHGPYPSSMALLETGLFQKQGIRDVRIAGYPEGSRRLETSLLDQALREKCALARRDGLDLSVTTQFCFSVPPIIGWTRRIRAMGIEIPVRVGLAGPSTLGTLVKYALRCGIGNSLDAIFSRKTSVTQLMAVSVPDELVGGLAAAQATGTVSFAGIHLFVFGGIARTAKWLDGVRS